MVLLSLGLVRLRFHIFKGETDRVLWLWEVGRACRLSPRSPDIHGWHRNAQKTERRFERR